MLRFATDLEVASLLSCNCVVRESTVFRSFSLGNFPLRKDPVNSRTALINIGPAQLFELNGSAYFAVPECLETAPVFYYRASALKQSVRSNFAELVRSEANTEFSKEIYGITLLICSEKHM